MLFLVGLGFLVTLRSINVFVFDWLVKFNRLFETKLNQWQEFFYNNLGTISLHKKVSTKMKTVFTKLYFSLISMDLKEN